MYTICNLLVIFDVLNSLKPPQVQSLVALGRCHTKEGKQTEAAAAFEKAISEAGRCKIKLFQLIALADCVACKIGDDLLFHEISTELGLATVQPAV